MIKIVCMVFVLLIFSFAHVCSAECGDVNGDETVDIVDALLIAQYYVSLDSMVRFLMYASDYDIESYF